MEITGLKTHLPRYNTDPLPSVYVSNNRTDSQNDNSGQNGSKRPETRPRGRKLSLPAVENCLPEVENSIPEVENTIPEITYGMAPRTAWMFRYSLVSQQIKA